MTLAAPVPRTASAAEIERLLRTSRLFSGVDPAVTAQLAASTRRKTYARGEALWQAGQPASALTIIISGLVKIVRRAPDQTDCIVGIFGPRESIGDAAVVSRGKYPAGAVAATSRVEVLRVDAAPVLAAMAREPSAANALSRSLVEHTLALQDKIEVLSAGAVPQRLAMLLLWLSERFGDEHDDGTLSVPIVLSRGELACLIGARVETTIRTITRWQKEGLVETMRDGIVIRDPERLREVVRALGDDGDGR